MIRSDAGKATISLSVSVWPFVYWAMTTSDPTPRVFLAVLVAVVVLATAKTSFGQLKSGAK